MRRFTRRGMAPDAAMAIRLWLFCFARRRISPAADLCSSGRCEASLRRSSWIFNCSSEGGEEEEEEALLLG